MSIKSLLTNHITGYPDTLQFAKDRKYEDSWIIPISQTQPTGLDIDKYLAKDPFKLLIAEYIWNSRDDNKRFVLTLFLDDQCQLKDPQTFVKICLLLFYQQVTFPNLLNTLDQKVIGHPYLLLNQADSVNLSVFNHWLSVGPVELWQTGDAYDQTAIETKIKSRPEIERTPLNYQGLLFRFNVLGQPNGPYYGLKTPCCTKQGDYWVIDYQKIAYWMKAILD